MRVSHARRRLSTCNLEDLIYPVLCVSVYLTLCFTLHGVRVRLSGCCTARAAQVPKCWLVFPDSYVCVSRTVLLLHNNVPCEGYHAGAAQQVCIGPKYCAARRCVAMDCLLKRSLRMHISIVVALFRAGTSTDAWSSTTSHSNSSLAGSTSLPLPRLSSTSRCGESPST